MHLYSGLGDVIWYFLLGAFLHEHTLVTFLKYKNQSFHLLFIESDNPCDSQKTSYN